LIKATGKAWKSGDQGAATAIVAAFDPNLNGMSCSSMRDAEVLM
jgi:ubiquitin